MFENIAGHKKQIQLLKKALEKGKLAHAYVFAGPDGVGKRSLAKELAWEILREREEGRGKREDYFHPDFLEISGIDGIKIEQIRELTYKLSLKPYQAENKVALIDNADQMSTEAANSLLKVLEEPKAYNYIFLITGNPNKLPKTILSRCQKITFGPLPVNERANLNIVLDEDAQQFQKQSEEFFQVFLSNNASDRLVKAYDIADLETHEIKKVLETWIMKLEIMLLENPSKALAHKIYQLSVSRRFLEQNVNTKLLLTNLMINT